MKQVYTLLFFCVAWSPFFAQTSISGMVNSYTAVTALDYCAAKLTVTNASGFQPGQAVLLIQMQGATINESNSASFGDITNLGNAGLYERGRIYQINGNAIFLENQLLHTYTPSGKVQLVGIAEYTAATVTGALTAQAWNGSTGGILALEVTNTLTLQAPIQVDGKGFRGGQVNVVNSNCQWFLNENDYFYDQSNWRGAKKAKGIATVITGKECGRGPQANGGGGGNDHNAGGGGGAQVATGGLGGLNTPSSSFGCDGDFPGMGGKSPGTATDRIFLGGGGGAGHADDPGTGSSGGTGGGIILLWAGSIDGNGFALSSKGLTPAVTTGDGAGGGGGGGTILVTYTAAGSSFDITLNGGNGGNTQNLPDRCYAPGGGGSGGRFLRNGPVVASVQLNGGAPGINTVASTYCNTPYNGATAGTGGQQQPFSGVPEGATPVEFPAITQQPPATLLFCENPPLTLSVQASGSDLQFQWQVNMGSGFTNLSNNAFYSGTQTHTLLLLDPQPGWDGYQYQCVITSGCFDPVTTQSTTLSVGTPAIAGFTFTVDGTFVQFQNTSLNADSVLWAFGDGNQSTAFSPGYDYTTEGTYTVILTAFGDCGATTSTQTIQVGFPPAADFGSDFTAGCAPLTVHFEDMSSGLNLTSLEWIFPGGQPASSGLPDPIITYSTPGQFDVTLIAGNAVGFDTLILENYLEVVPVPQAFFAYSVSGDTVFFTNGSIGSSLNYTWDFGDDTTPSNSVNPVHLYPGPGIYEVTLTALNTYCASSTSILIQVGPNASGDISSRTAIQFFPNPVSDKLHVIVAGSPPLELRCWNALGIRVYQVQVQEGTQLIDMRGWAPGLYWIEWMENGSRHGYRLLKL
ncbi:MAG: PKD domain-containing protein [Saprospirales bacterium]|nr:PKD domain-containing protein [Saprospirales bacterium]